MNITKTPFGTLPGGEQADLYTITNARGAFVTITNYGGIVTQIHVPDREGNLADVALGCATLADYIPNNGYLGALIGRCGNRINRGKLTLNGKEIDLAANAGGHHLHGGDVGFDKKLWDATAIPEKGELILSYVSADGEENYPGTLRATVTYTFTEDNELRIHYQAQSDQDTLCNLTNHSYFNLAGEASGKDILDHEIAIYADRFTVVDADCIPTGEERAVDGTVFDLRAPRRIADGLKMIGTDEQMTFGGGYDHNFVLGDLGMSKAASVYCPETGRTMDVYTDQPSVQLYVGNMLDGTMKGKSGALYAPRAGLCLETQVPPDAINHPNFASSILRAGEAYDTTTIYHFTVR